MSATAKVLVALALPFILSLQVIVARGLLVLNKVVFELLSAYLDEPRRSYDGLFAYAKFVFNQYSGFDNMEVLTYLLTPNNVYCVETSLSVSKWVSRN